MIQACFQIRATVQPFTNAQMEFRTLRFQSFLQIGQVQVTVTISSLFAILGMQSSYGFRPR